MKSVLASLLVLVMGSVCARPFEDGVPFAVRGEPPHGVVVLPENPSESQRYAAEELVKYVRRMTGVSVPIGERGAARAAIVLKTSDAYGPDGFSLASDLETLTISGSAARGCLYGVYEFLERQGCGFYAEWYEKIPARERILIPANLRVEERPTYALREILYGGMGPSIRAKYRSNRSMWEEIPPKFGGNVLRSSKTQRGHSFYRLVPPKEYFATHPEYFALVKGKRTASCAQLCLSNPEVYRIIRDKILAAMRAEPWAQVFELTPNDEFGYCECPDCKAVDDAEDSHAGSYVKFLVRLADDVAKEFPQNYLRGGAYQYTRRAPKNMMLRKNILFGFAPVESDFFRSLELSEYGENARALAEIGRWATKGGTFLFTDYTTNFRQYPIAWPDIVSTADNLRLFRNFGFSGAYALGPHEGRGSFLPELRAWLIAKLMWNADRDVDALVREFCAGYYGPAVGPIAYEYVKRLHAPGLYTKEHPLKIYDPCDHPAITDEFLAWALAEWTRAETLAKDDPAYAEHVAFAKYSTVYHILRRNAAPVWASSDRAKAEALRDLIGWLARFVDSAKDPLIIRESGPSLRAESYYRDWLRLLKGGDGMFTGVGSVGANRIVTFQPGNWNTREADADALDGKAIRILPTCNSWSVQFDLTDVAFTKDCPYRVQARVRVRKTPAAKPEDAALVCGLSNHGDSNDPNRFQKTFAFSELGEAYALVDLGTFVPRTGEYLWFAIGGYDRPGFTSNPGLAGVWIDRLVFSESRLP